MATYNDIHEEPVTTGSADVVITASAPEMPPPQQQHDQYRSFVQGDVQDDYEHRSPSEAVSGLTAKLGLGGAALTVIGAIIACSGFAALTSMLECYQIIAIIAPVVLVLLLQFFPEKVPSRRVFNLINAVVCASVSLWSFFTFVVMAKSSSHLSSLGQSKEASCNGAVASGMFFVFLGHALMVYYSYQAM